LDSLVLGINPEVLRRVEALRPKRVLDFGCGRGVEVLELLRLGYDAVGADIDRAEVAVGRRLLADEGEAADRLHVMDDRIPFDDESFDFVFSQEVLEHVEDLAPVAQELYRVTAPGGVQYHVFPARFRPMETHLEQPFVHWLPENRARRYAIQALGRVGVGLPNRGTQPLAEHARDAYRYTLERTFYRSHHAIRAEFERPGFRVRSVGHQHRRLPSAARRIPRAVDVLMRTFVTEHLLLERPVPER
jgi:SAM-dependent methyltransferase